MSTSTVRRIWQKWSPLRIDLGSGVRFGIRIVLSAQVRSWGFGHNFDVGQLELSLESVLGSIVISSFAN